jgi:MerR family transcriptional regulator/heat shock protein HspR
MTIDIPENDVVKESSRQESIYSIGTVARMLGVSVHTLRLYEREGLILTEKSDGNQRRYSEEDLERLRCIRTAITEEKLSIEGIKRIHSLIPCWEIVGCSQEDREQCPAYRGHEKGCWAYRHRGTICEKAECKRCSVYQLSGDCGSIKEQLIKVTHGEVLLRDHDSVVQVP